MISHSPPIFSHSPPVSFLADYMGGHQRSSLNYNDDTNRTAARYCRPQVITLASKAMLNNASNAAAAPPLPPPPTTIITAATTTAFRSTATGATPLGVGSRSGRSYLERIVSMPQMNTRPKSCLRSQTKSCQHRTNTTTTTTNPTTNNNNKLQSQANDVIDFEQSSSRKKHVIFADDEGLSLTEVRVMSEPSNVPPYWSMKFLEQITQGLVSPHPADQWTVDFKQPASDYLTFRQKIERDYVSLENVIVKDEESIVVGTIKVKNIDFQKEVIVRVTWDDWKSQQDIFCTFARAYGLTTCAHVVFDTFSFKITLPPSSKRLEFCICYRSKDKEFWDNNDGKNYTISKRSPFYYNALSPYDKNRSSCQSQIRSTLTDAIAKTQQDQQQQGLTNNQSTPYW